MIDVNTENVPSLSRKVHVTVDSYRNKPDRFSPRGCALSLPATVPRGFPPLLASARLSFFEQSSLLPGPSDVGYKKCRKKRVGGEKKVGETL